MGPAENCRGQDKDGCVPINLFGAPGSVTQAQLDYLEVTAKVVGESKLSSYSFTAARTLGRLPFGDLEFALGLEYRDESISKKPDELLDAGLAIGANNLAPTHGGRDVAEIYAESIIPIWSSPADLLQLDLEIAMRYSKYSDFGDITNPKYGLRFQMTPSILLRATHAQGFRAPSLSELHGGPAESRAPITDPCTNAANVGTLPGCSVQADPLLTEYLTVTSGNPKLDPEKSRSFGLGVVWTPAFAQGFSTTVDYFDIDTSQVVDSSAQFVLNQNAATGDFSDQVLRDANGNLQQVHTQRLNVGERRVQGVDVGLNYRLPRRDWGQVSTSLNVAYIGEYTLQLDNDDPTRNLAGSFRDPAAEGVGGIPRWKGNLGVQWARQRWRGSYELHFVSDMKEVIPGTDSQRLIRNYLVHDLQFSYVFNVLKGLRWTVGVDNLLDEDPPLAASAYNDNHDARTHDLRGRFWYTKLSQRL